MTPSAEKMPNLRIGKMLLEHNDIKPIAVVSAAREQGSRACLIARSAAPACPPSATASR